MSGRDWELIGTIEDFGEGDRISVIIDDYPALVIRHQDRFFGIEDVCTHDGQPLSDGTVEAGEIECPRHGARFDLATGKPACMPATQPVQIFDIEQRGDELFAAPALKESADFSSDSSATAQTTTESADSTEPQPEAGAEQSVTPSTPMVGDMLDALKAVVDPELFVNIVDLGLVYDITEENQNVVVTMTLTSPSCPAGPQIVSQARETLEKMPGIESAEIKMTMSPPWTPEMMTEDARDQLGIF